ncbi:MAG: hypothetical protein AABY22_04540 [Nanoarchaeota archaeon]
MVLKDLQSRGVTEYLALSVIIFIGVIATFIYGLALTGFDDPFTLTQFQVYVAVGSGASIIIYTLITVELLTKKDDKKYGSSVLFFAPGDIIKLPGRYHKILSNPLSIIMLSLIVITIMVLTSLVFNVQTAFTPFPILKQQFTPGENFVFSLILVPVVENLSVATVWAFFVVFLRRIARKIKMSPNIFRFLVISGLIISGLIYGILLHSSVYRESETDLITSGIFWGFGGLVTGITQNFLPFLFIHDANNAVFGLLDFFSREAVLVYLIVFLVVLIITYGIFIYNLIFKKKRRR